MRALVVGTLLIAPGLAFACGGKKSSDSHTDCDTATAAAAAAADPAHCARKAELVGSKNCSYTTGMMAQRVLDDGAPYTYVGRLSVSDNTLESRVAAPFTLGPEDDRIHVVANEVIDLLEQHGATQRRVDLQGKVLEVDGITYFVATAVNPGNT
jgi:hypothetical protein